MRNHVDIETIKADVSEVKTDIEMLIEVFQYEYEQGYTDTRELLINLKKSKVYFDRANELLGEC